MYLILLIIRKFKTKKNFVFILKESYLILKVREVSFYFWFKKGDRFNFFLCMICINNEIVHKLHFEEISGTYFFVA